MTPPPPPAALGQEIYSRGFRFRPTPQQAISYYLPRLISGDETLHEAVRAIIHHADVYSSSPAELARRFRPMPRTGDRFFFTPCNSNCKKKAIVRAGTSSSSSSWATQTTAEIMEKDVKIGELKKLRYKKRGVLTDWLMEEYSSSSCGAGAGDGDNDKQFVLCKVYVSPRAALGSVARHESAASFALPPATVPAPAPAAAVVVVVAQPAAKRKAPPPPPLPAAMPPCAKRMRGPALQPTAPQPPVLPALIRSPVTAGTRMCFAPAPPQPCAALCVCGSPAPSSTQRQPSPAPIHAPAPPAPTRHVVEPRRSPMPAPPRPLARPKQQVPLPTPPLVRASCHMPRQALPPAPCRPQVVSVQWKQRSMLLDPFEAATLREQAENAEPDPPLSKQFPAAAAPPVLQDDDDEDDDDLVKALEDAISTAEAEEETVAAAPQDKDDEDYDEDDWDDLARELGIEE